MRDLVGGRVGESQHLTQNTFTSDEKIRTVHTVQREIFTCKIIANLPHESCFAVLISQFWAEQLYLHFFQYSYP